MSVCVCVCGMSLCLVPLKAIVKKSFCKLLRYLFDVFQLSEVSVSKATEVELLTWVDGRRGEKGERETLQPSLGLFEC